MSKSYRKTGMLFILVAIICSLLAVIVAYTAVNRLTKKESILVANSYIVAGDPLTKDMFNVIQVPRGGIVEDAIRPNSNINIEQFIAVKDMSEKDILRYTNVADLGRTDLPILSSRLRRADKEIFGIEEYSDELFQNLRAAEIPIGSIQGMVDGMKVGDKISVTSLFIEENEKAEKIRRIETIFDHIYILGIKRNDENSSGNVVIAITQKQFEALTLAREKGTFYISLMPFGIEKPEDHPEILSDLYIQMLERPEENPVSEADLEKIQNQNKDENDGGL